MRLSGNQRDVTKDLALLPDCGIAISRSRGIVGSQSRTLDEEGGANGRRGHRKVPQRKWKWK